MTWKKGESGNKSGRSGYEQRMLRNLKELTPRAIARLGKLIDSENEAIALGSIKEVLDRNLGKARQSAVLDVNVTATHAAHLAALDTLAKAKLGPILDLNISENINEIKMIDGGDN